jgi:hypothetical protein
MLGMLILAVAFCPQSYAQMRVKRHANGISLQSVAYHPDSLRPCPPEQFFQKELQLGSDHRLQLTDSLPVGSTTCRLTYQQYYRGLPVIDGRVALLYSKGCLVQYGGFYLPIAEFDTAATLSVQDAEAIYRSHFALPESLKVELETEKAIAENPDSAARAVNPALLCYRITPVSGAGKTLCLNALSGAVLFEKGHSADASLNTYYYGQQSVPNAAITAASYCPGSGYMLKTAGSDSRIGFVVTDPDGYWTYAGGTFVGSDCSPFTDADNNWTASDPAGRQYVCAGCLLGHLQVAAIFLRQVSPLRHKRRGARRDRCLVGKAGGGGGCYQLSRHRLVDNG